MFEKQLRILYLQSVSIFAILLFLYGFFPIKNRHDTRSIEHDIPPAFKNIGSEEQKSALTGRLIFMVIDALRLDFVEGLQGPLNFPYVASLLENNSACLIYAKADTPTVTMPRIKAMTTGSVPNFVDIIQNLGSSEIYEDNWIQRARKKGHRLIFYGDETWLKLFPHDFMRREGTTSFFVSDFFEVDNNVTRYVAPELEAEDWTVMLLHYLGLDHIGHVEGPQSPRIRNKLQEMDRIIEVIHKKMKIWGRKFNATFILTGDHGIRDSGSHGGASYAEIMVPIVLIGSHLHCRNNKVVFPQVDLAPTISVLLGISMPLSNVGTILPPVLETFSTKMRLNLLFKNANQVANLYKMNVHNFVHKDCYEDYIKAVDSHNLWISNMTDNEEAKHIEMLYLSSLRNMSSELTNSYVKFDTHGMVVAFIIIFQTAVITILPIREKLSSDVASISKSVAVNGVIFLVFNCFYCKRIDSCGILCGTHVASVVITSATIFFASMNTFIISEENLTSKTAIKKKLETCFSSPIGVLMVAGTILHGVSLCSSSYIEEEHQLWYFLWPSLCLLTLFSVAASLHSRRVPKLRYYWQSITSEKRFILMQGMLVMFLHRIIRKLNQTGDKWISLPDIGDWLVLEQNKIWMSATLMLGLIGVSCSGYFLCIRRSDPRKRKLLNGVLFIVPAVCIYCYRGTTGIVTMPSEYEKSKGVKEARLFWCFVTLMLMKVCGETMYKLKLKSTNRLESMSLFLNYVTATWILLSGLLHRSQNVVLPAVQVFASNFVFSALQLENGIEWVTIAHIWIGQTFYFYQGNSNSLASIDISSGYVGQEEFNLFKVGSFVACNTYSAIVLSHLLLFTRIVSWSQQGSYKRFEERIGRVFHTTFIVRVIPMATYLLIIIFQRYHLFVWTVFSPKLLFESCCTFVTFVLLLLTFIVMKLFSEVEKPIEEFDVSR